MVKQETAAAAPKEKPKAKRTILSPAERAAKLRADAAALEAKVAEQAKGKIKAQEERVAQLQGQVDDRQKKLDAAKAELVELRTAAGEEPVEEPAES